MMLTTKTNVKTDSTDGGNYNNDDGHVSSPVECRCKQTRVLFLPSHKVSPTSVSCGNTTAPVAADDVVHAV